MKASFSELAEWMTEQIRGDFQQREYHNHERQSWAKQNAETLGSIARQLQDLHGAVTQLEVNHLRLLDRIQELEDTRSEARNGDPGEGTQESDNRPVDSPECGS